jgi:hypothetical protein
VPLHVQAITLGQMLVDFSQQGASPDQGKDIAKAARRPGLSGRVRVADSQSPSSSDDEEEVADEPQSDDALDAEEPTGSVSSSRTVSASPSSSPPRSGMILRARKTRESVGAVATSPPSDADATRADTDTSSGRTPAQLEALLKPPARVSKAPWDAPGLKALSYYQLGSRPKKGLADQLVAEMEEKAVVFAEEMVEAEEAAYQLKHPEYSVGEVEEEE